MCAAFEQFSRQALSSSDIDAAVHRSEHLLNPQLASAAVHAQRHGSADTAGQQPCPDTSDSDAEEHAEPRGRSPHPEPLQTAMLRRTRVPAERRARANMWSSIASEAARDQRWRLRTQPLPPAVLQRAPTSSVNIVLNDSAYCYFNQEARTVLLGPQPLPHGSYAVTAVTAKSKLGISFYVKPKGDTFIGKVC